MRAVADLGYAQTTVGDIVTYARISRRTFYEHFPGKEECFLEAYDMAIERVGALVSQAQSEKDSWPEKLLAGLEVFLELVVAEPDLGRMCLLEIAGAGPRALRRREVAMKGFAADMRNLAASDDSVSAPPPDLAAELVVGGLSEIITARLVAGEPEALFAELPQMLYCALVPFVGHGEATAMTDRMLAERTAATV